MQILPCIVDLLREAVMFMDMGKLWARVIVSEVVSRENIEAVVRRSRSHTS